MDSSLPTPPLEDSFKGHSHKKQQSTSKPVKPVHKTQKRASTHSHPSPPAHHDGYLASSMGDGRHKRVWKACERCRMKKTKCDGEFPCKRCKDDGLVCTAGTRKKTEYKQLPRGYAEVIENTQFALIATVHKLYSMVRNSQPWALGEPELNERGQPVIHNIAQTLGCIRPNADVDLPVHSVFPEDEAGLAELARQLEAQQIEQQSQAMAETDSVSGATRSFGRANRASSSEPDHSDLEFDNYRRSAFGGRGNGSGSSVAMSPQSMSYTDFDVNSVSSDSGFGPAAAPAGQSPTVLTSYPSWPTSMGFSNPQFLPQAAGPGPFLNMDPLSQGLLESEFGTIKPHMLSCSNPEVMMGMGDPMMYGGFEQDLLRQ